MESHIQTPPPPRTGLWRGASRIGGLIAGTFLLGACVAVATPWDWGSGFAWNRSSGVFVLHAVSMLLAGTLLVFLLQGGKVRPSRRGLMIACLVLGSFALGLVQALMWSFRVARDNHLVGTEGRTHDVAPYVLYTISVPMATLTNLLMDTILLERVAMLGRILGRPCSVRCARRLWRAEAFFSVLCWVILLRFVVPSPSDVEDLIYLIAGSGSIFFSITRATLGLLALRVFLIPVLRLRTAAGEEWGAELEESHPGMRSTANLEFLAVAFNVSFAVAMPSLVAYNIVADFALLELFSWSLVAMDVISNMGLMLVMTGMFKHDSERERAARQAERRRREKQAARCAAYRRDADRGWQESVEDLAGRGFTLERLLAFYKALPEAMPHFDPGTHRTTDIVRQVIIPQSADRRCAYAVLMMDGVPTRPQRMVTHNWSNLFRDLVAAIVADALNEPCFLMTATLLDRDIPALERMLGAEALALTYWVCAFSVNQHASICSSVSSRAADPKTGAKPPACACGHPKHLNSTPPFRADGKSIPCQMNKFDDMMASLSAASPDFAQVVAVDRGFWLFSRAWCVAEIAEANAMGMRQSVKLSSRQALKGESAKLRDLDVRNMEAARMEDVTEILAKIPDVGRFNADLQQMLFGKQGLFDSLDNFDVIERAAQIGKATLFASASLQSGSGGGAAGPKADADGGELAI